MTAANTQTEEQLVDLLDEALREIRRGQPVDCATWSRTHPELTAEGTCLLETLTLLTSAASVWRGGDPGDIGTAPEPSDDTECGLPVVIGRYQIRSRVGSGSMGIVYEGYDPHLDRRVAVKIPRCERLAKDRAIFVERFIREARAAAAVRHAHVCPVYDTGQHDDQPYVVMAFVEGETLEAVLSRGRIEDVPRAVKLATQIAEALDAVHQQGIIHRDLKPGNVLIDRDGNGLLTDFGLAVSNVNVERLTSDGLIVGTPVYMSPEQAAGENSTLTPASDIYSLGVMFHEMLTGTVPFRGPLLELLRRIQSEAPAPITTLRPDCDPALSDIARRAMAKRPADRFKSAAEMAAALRGCLDSQHSSKVSAEVPEPRPTVGEHKQLHRLRTGSLSAIMIGAILLAAVGWGLSARNGTRPSGDLKQQSAVANQLPQTIPLSPLKGDVEITIWSDPEKPEQIGNVKNGVPISKVDLGALPLRNGELVHLHVTLNRPAFVYLFWIDSDGQTTPLYPWDADHSKAAWAAPLLKESATPTAQVHCPADSNRGFGLLGAPGMQHVLLLARSTPLAAPEKSLQAAFANLPTSPLTNRREVAYLEWSPASGSEVRVLRGIEPGKTKQFSAPVFDQLRARLQSDFELIKVWRFAQVEE